MGIQITIDIEDCQADCTHAGHSGGFTRGGPRTLCDHPESVKYATRCKTSVKDDDDKFHWRHRVVKSGKIPGWCPLRHGCKY